jgi:hypothetical protein
MPGPHYPHHFPQPNSGTYGPPGSPDLRPSTAPAPVFQAAFQQQNGRRLAGIGVVQDEGSEPAWAANELQYLAEMDDVQGNGVFDPPGAKPNIHPDAGVFAARYSIPGYEARERPFSMSEVRDVTTGRPIRAVPSGAVAMDSAAQIAFIERGMFQPPQPIINDVTAQDTPSVSTAWVYQNAEPIGQDNGNGNGNGNNNLAKVLGITLGAGLALGAGWALFQRKKRR